MSETPRPKITWREHVKAMWPIWLFGAGGAQVALAGFHGDVKWLAIGTILMAAALAASMAQIARTHAMMWHAHAQHAAQIGMLAQAVGLVPTGEHNGGREAPEE